MNIGPKTQLSWHGGSQAIIATGGAIALLKDWPTDWQWIIIAVTGILAAVKGIDALLTNRTSV